MKACLVVIFLLGGSDILSAGPFRGIHPLLSDRIAIGALGFWPTLNSSISVDDANGDQGTDVDMDDLFGSGTEFRMAMAVNWRMSERSRWSLEWFSVNNKGQADLKENIEWDDVVYEAGVRLRGNTDFDVYRLFYGYSLLRDEKMEMGMGAGLHLMNLQAELSGNATLEGVPIGNTKRGVNVWAPLPNIGGFLNYAFSPQWLISSQLDWFSANVGDYDGSLWHAGAALHYQVSRNFGLGAGYRYFKLDIAVDKKGEWKGDANNRYGGPVLFATVNF